MAEQKIVNGVNVGDLASTIKAVRNQPDLAKSQFRARIEWLDGGHCRTNIKDFYTAGQEDTSRTEPFVFNADEPPVLLGENRGANPVEYALTALASCLTALASCLTTTLIYHAAARGIQLEEVEAKLEGDLDLQGFLGISDDVRRGYENVRVTFKVKGDGDAEKLAELAKYSPVFDIFSNPVPVSVRVEKK